MEQIEKRERKTEKNYIKNTGEKVWKWGFLREKKYPVLAFQQKKGEKVFFHSSQVKSCEQYGKTFRQNLTFFSGQINIQKIRDEDPTFFPRIRIRLSWKNIPDPDPT